MVAWRQNWKSLLERLDRIKVYSDTLITSTLAPDSNPRERFKNQPVQHPGHGQPQVEVIVLGLPESRGIATDGCDRKPSIRRSRRQYRVQDAKGQQVVSFTEFPQSEYLIRDEVSVIKVISKRRGFRENAVNSLAREGLSNTVAPIGGEGVVGVMKVNQVTRGLVQ
jgi:hypothetical protein